MRVFLTMIFLTACSDNCEPLATRCHNGTVEICTTEENWELQDDCRDVVMYDFTAEKWLCCDDNLVHICLPEC